MDLKRRGSHFLVDIYVIRSLLKDVRKMGPKGILGHLGRRYEKSFMSLGRLYKKLMVFLIIFGAYLSVIS